MKYYYASKATGERVTVRTVNLTDGELVVMLSTGEQMLIRDFAEQFDIAPAQGDDTRRGGGAIPEKPPTS